MRTTFVSFLMCVWLAACSGPSKNDCNDGVDNDGDGLVDGLDPGCVANGNAESPDPKQCNDHVDNDGDGKVDYPDDPGCNDPTDDNEMDPVYQCGNGLDDDADGKVDFPADPGCTSATDNDESNPPECMDGIDDDGDGITDFPFDPGCADAMDDDETDPSPLPECANSIDDDGDSFTDYPNDPGCDSAGDDTEFNTTTGACGPGVVITDISMTHMATGSVTMAAPNVLSSPVCNGLGSESAYTYVLSDGPKSLLITTDTASTTLDTVIYVRTTCMNSATELGCNDDGAQNADGMMQSAHGSTLLLDSVPNGTYYIIVDSFGPGSLGNFSLSVSERVPLHGMCDVADPLACLPGLICRSVMAGAPTTCELHVCEDGVDNDGDGIIDYPLEPGCLSSKDDDETDPTPEPQCANGVDDDGDALVDYAADPGCSAASDDLEQDECTPGKVVTALDPNVGVTDSTTGETDTTHGACVTGGSPTGPEKVYSLTPTIPLDSITLTTDNPPTTFDTLLYVRDNDCALGTEVACDDDLSGTNVQSTVTFAPVMGHRYFVFVDGKLLASGTFQLTVSGIIHAGGVCDPTLPAFACSSGYACKESVVGAADWQCRVSLCHDAVDNDGDGYTDYPFDPGCATASDDDEVDPTPEPQCWNGADDDGDGHIDWPADPGCAAAGDNDETDQCIPGEPFALHPGGTVMGDTTFGPSNLGAPTSCDAFGSSNTANEQVYLFNLTQPVANLHFDTLGSSFDTFLYVRSPDCAAPGPASWCNNDSGGGNTSVVDIASPALGPYYAVVDGNLGGEGPFNLTIQGQLALGSSCTAGDATYVCVPGAVCTGGVCVASQCNNGTDDDGDSHIDDFDPGCSDVSDDSESPDPSPLPQCANGLDDDGDSMVDYPADSGCSRASDDTEGGCAHDVCTAGGPLTAACDPCAGSVCGLFPTCCTTAWDMTCVLFAGFVCGATCP